MNIFVYSDESGVFDKVHNDYFVFGGLVFLGKDDRDVWARKYIHAENTIRSIEHMLPTEEVKAAAISNKSKGKLYRSLNKAEKFALVVSQAKLKDPVFGHKKTKQRYLDWAYKMVVKEKLIELMNQGLFRPSDVENLYFFVDEHTTAKDGLYELKETLEQEFRVGTYNFDYNTFHPPLFPGLKSLTVRYCNSATTTLVRAADIIANHVYYTAISQGGDVKKTEKLYIKKHP